MEEEDQPSYDELFDKATVALEAVAEGTGDLNDARVAFMEISDFRPKGMEPERTQGPEQHYGDAANSMKMAIDALEGDQRDLAKTYLKVAKIKLDKAREVSG